MARRVLTTAVAVLATSASVSAQSSCSASCKGTTSDGTAYDLSKLMGQDYQTVGSDQNADTYFLNVCGTSASQCPDDAGDPPVTQGTVVQTVQAGGCYVLGVSYVVLVYSLLLPKSNYSLFRFSCFVTLCPLQHTLEHTAIYW